MGSVVLSMAELRLLVAFSPCAAAHDRVQVYLLPGVHVIVSTAPVFFGVCCPNTLLVAIGSTGWRQVFLSALFLAVVILPGIFTG
jgi:hypothetical protein